MTILEKVQAAEIGTVALDVDYTTHCYVKVSVNTWSSVEESDNSDEYVASRTSQSKAIYLIPPSALAQFEVTEDAS